MKDKKIPMEKILNITEELNPDDIGAGEIGNLECLVECKDDSSPDDELLSNANRSYRKENPTHDPNPDKMLYLQGYEGEMERELASHKMQNSKGGSQKV